jgi:hypothetical protein
LKAQPVLDVSFGIEMKDRRRLIRDPHIVLADKMRKIVVLRQTFTTRFGDNAGQLAPQAAVSDPIDLLFEIYSTVPYLQRR